jgi:oligopeptidase A
LEEVIKPIEQHLVPLNYALITMRTLRNVEKSKFNFKTFDKFYERINGVKIRRFQSQQIYYFMREIKSDKNKLNNEQKRIVNKYLLEAKLFGTHLPLNDLNSLNTIHKQLIDEQNNYRKKLDEATKRFTHTIDDPLLLQVFPDELIAAIGSHSNATVTLHSSVFNPFMEYCPDRLLRWNLWMAYNSRASPATDPRLSNSVNIEEIRSLRKKQAQLLGYENYVELSMETKMARNVQNVKAMISTLHSKSKSAFDNNMKELTNFALERNFESEKLELWDLPYWQRKLLKSKYSIEDTLIRQYFPLNSVINGMFKLAEKLFHIKIEEVLSGQFDSWHKDVKLFRILSAKSGIIASFFFDPYARINEKSVGAWNDMSLPRCDSLKTKPLSCFITNLPKPLINGQSTQLSFTQILLLFKQVLQLHNRIVPKN